jgi:DNA-binding response OmpR family regulator
VIVIGRIEDDAVDRVRAFQRGCDDWVEQPFAYDELLARIRAVLRRTAPSPDDVLEAGPVRVDGCTRSVTVRARASSSRRRSTTCSSADDRFAFRL